ncbi:type I-E CRISPR-associated protein Cas5/CasD [Allochromatium humboldtianum]|uniref:Type I-E CRISPR-associated protein Cas5/CasD n=2 Tax=Allochromatium humboldtianum TaxID=504901 RepID=A0A850RJI6_9GAMM|nr:type I-E CRISPR-associated protein Cas5/CasD [Allochromatium humboldtianum]NVZ11040.1 type I-E CRISPR-associated protein Cas5/CasD [Allochromatium humboldtianum]
MPSYLILRLDGPMQAWGTHTFEDYRPSNPFPTRSGLLGLLGACLGLDRSDTQSLDALAESVAFTVRLDTGAPRPGVDRLMPKRHTKLSDYHTVLDARKVDGSTNKFPIQSHREYLFDAAFTVAIGSRPDASFSLARIAESLRRPRFTPVLGRRSCPLGRPLLERPDCIEADDAKAALAQFPPHSGLIYSEDELVSDQPTWIRDVPRYGRHRQFATRRIHLHRGEESS